MKIKRIFAIIAVVLLVALYGSTVVFALSDSPNAIYMFKASIFCTVIIPVILYSYILVYRIFGKKPTHHSQPEDDSEQNHEK